MKAPISRREFLKGSLAATGLTIAASVTPFGYKILSASELKEGAASSFKPNVWLQITPDDRVTVTLGAAEMGQGSHTSLAMIIADELDADWQKVKIRQGPAAKEFFNPIMHSQIAVASSTVRGFYWPLRKVGASARGVLLRAASSMLGVPESECEVSKGTVRHKKTGRSMTYGQLCMKASTLPLPKEPQLKKDNEFIYMGNYVPRSDIPSKVAGKAVYGIDVTLPNMLYAVLARPPAYGAKPLSFDRLGAERVKGVRKVVPTPHGIGVCADTLQAAWKGRDALNVTWDKGLIPEMDTEYVEKSLIGGLDKPGSTAANIGDAGKALSEAHKKIEATYYVPFVAHTTMEPMNCTAHVQKDRCDVWVPTQAQTVSQIVASKVSRIPQNKVNIHTTYLGGGLGRRASPDFVVEAVLLSKAVGKPVKVIWTREEDIKYDAFRAAMAHRIKAGLDSRGRLTAWNHKVVSGSILKGINPKAIKNGVDFMSLWGLLDFPNSPHNNRIMYEIPNFFVEFLLSDLPIPVSPWRSVQNAPNAFVIESFVDELAYAAGKDPLEFRLSLLKNNKRPYRVLEKVAQEAGWGKPGLGQGRGIAQHSCFKSYVAQVADVSVNKEDGTVKVHRIVAAVDCGPPVNPDNIKAQVMGAIVMGLSTTLKEEVKFADGGVASENFDDYGILRMSETPEIEVHIVNNKDKIGGIGEPGVPPTAPAVANAVFDATGVRFRRIPLTPERVLAGLKGKQS